jgi:hypothetical protein
MPAEELRVGWTLVVVVMAAAAAAGVAEASEVRSLPAESSKGRHTETPRHDWYYYRTVQYIRRDRDSAVHAVRTFRRERCNALPIVHTIRRCWLQYSTGHLALPTT